jgi:3-hydroxybutyryl-CoA dehydrogenase
MTGTVGVIGAGTMGAGIAYAFATAGWATTVVEPDPLRAEGLRPALAARARTGVERGRLASERAGALDGLLAVTSDVDGLATGLDLVVETVPERMALKADVLAAAERRSPSLLATNTSALSTTSWPPGWSGPRRSAACTSSTRCGRSRSSRSSAGR